MSDSNPNNPPEGTRAWSQAQDRRIAWPCNPKGTITSGFGMRWGKMHEGTDIAIPNGSDVISALDGRVESANWAGGYGNYMVIDHGNSIKTAYAHLEDFIAGPGDQVSRGEPVAKSNNTGSSTGPHLHFEVILNGEQVDPQPYLDGAELIAGVPAGSDGGGGGGGGGGESLAKAAAFATFFNLASVTDRVRSQVLTGERSLMNDEPLFPFIQQVTEASLRNFQSMPNGNFFAFYPDYFGGLNHRTAYWKIQDIEIIDGNINLSDDALATHVYVVGSWEGTGYAPTAIDAFRELQSAGVVTIFNAFALDFLNGTTNLKTKIDDPFKSDEGLTAEQKERKRTAKEKMDTPNVIRKDNAIAFLKKYGARPDYQQMPLVKSRYYELFLAYQRFCLLWSQQFSTEFELTFMPELFPGGIVELADHGIQCYIEEVSHNCSYSGGFTTNVVLSAPASTNKNIPKNQNKNIGMIRSGIFAPGAIQAPGSG